MPPTRKVLVGAFILFVVWLPLINDYIWLFRSWITVKGFEIPGYYTGHAHFGTMSDPRREAQVVNITGIGCTDLAYVDHWNGTEPAIAMVRRGGKKCPDDVLVFELQSMGFSGVIVVGNEWVEGGGLFSSKKAVKDAIRVPSALIGTLGARSIRDAGSAEFAALVSHNTGLAIGGTGSFVLFMVALALLDSTSEGYQETGTGNEIKFTDEEPVINSAAYSSESVSPKQTQVDI